MTCGQLVAGMGELPMLILTAPDGARAVVYLHGAHVTSWVPAVDAVGGAEERLFLSTRAEWHADAAIRGGVPVIFPQFATQGPLPRHGFARHVEWELAGTGITDRAATATFRLVDSAATRAIWPHRFRAELSVTVGGAGLGLELAVTNTGDTEFEYTAALHTYLRVASVQQSEVHGLQGIRCRDAVAGGEERVDALPAVRGGGELNRIYLDVAGPVTVREPGRTMEVRATGFPDVVLWNPGPAAELPDLLSGEVPHMLCVEAAAVGTPIRLPAGGRWVGVQALTASPVAGGDGP
jgi:glucose-6-phosphate 1-epimerase